MRYGPVVIKDNGSTFHTVSKCYQINRILVINIEKLMKNFMDNYRILTFSLHWDWFSSWKTAVVETVAVFDTYKVVAVGKYELMVKYSLLTQMMKRQK